MSKDSSHIKSGFSCRNQESQQMEKKNNLGGGGFIIQTTNQMHPTVYVVHIICLQCLNPICHLQILSHSLPGQAHDTTKQQPNPPAVRFRESFQRTKGAPNPSSALLGGGRGEERGRPREDGEPSFGGLQLALARSCALLPVTAWKPVLMLATEQREWHVSHCRKQRRVSFCRMVSGERQV